MPTVKELQKKIEIEKAKQQRKEEKEALEKELFNLRHKRKIAFAGKVKATAIHMGRNAGAMAKTGFKKLQEAEKKAKKKKKGKKKKIQYGLGGFNLGY